MLQIVRILSFNMSFFLRAGSRFGISGGALSSRADACVGAIYHCCPTVLPLSVGEEPMGGNHEKPVSYR